MKSVGICNALLRVLLSVALVVSFTPIPAAAAEGVAVAGGSPSTSVGDRGSTLSEGSGEAASTGGGAAGASDAGAGIDAASPAGEGGGNAAGDASTPVDKGAGDGGDAADDPVERAADDELAQQGVLYAFGKLMASGYVYTCDERGDLTKPIDEDDPKRNAISAREVANLIVDYHVADIPEGLC